MESTTILTMLCVAQFAIIISLIVSLSQSNNNSLDNVKTISNIDCVSNTIDPKYKHCDIIQLPGGKYAPVYKNQYPFITSYGGATLHSTMGNFNTFNTYDECKKFLDEWLALRGIGIKSIGIK